MVETLKQEVCSSGKLDSRNQLDEEMCFLIRSDADEEYFAEHYNVTKDRVYFSMLQFREYKRSTRHMSLEEFLRMYEINRIEALEGLFQHPIIEYDVRQLEREIANNRITLRQLYELKQRHKKRRLLRLLFSTTD